MPKVRVESPLRRGGKTHEIGAELDLDAAVIAALPSGVVAAPVAAGEDELVAVIAEMDAAEHADGDWTKDRGPAVQALERRLGQDLTAEQRDAAWEAYQAQQAAERAAEGAGTEDIGG